MAELKGLRTMVNKTIKTNQRRLQRNGGEDDDGVFEDAMSKVKLFIFGSIKFNNPISVFSI